MADFGGFLRSDFGKLFFPENRHNTEPKTTEKPFVAILLNLTSFCAFPYRTTGDGSPHGDLLLLLCPYVRMSEFG